MSENRKLCVFLCHASQDKPVVRELYQRLLAEGWIDPWLDEEKLLPGQDWDLETEKAVEAADVVLVYLSNRSITKDGYIQRELKFVLDIALEKPEGAIFVIPLRLEECDLPRRLRSWQYVDYFPSEKKEAAYKKILGSLRTRVASLENAEDFQASYESVVKNFAPGGQPIYTFGNIEFVKIPRGKFIMGSKYDHHAADNEKPQHVVDISYDYWIGRFHITNEQFAKYASIKKINHPVVDWEKKTLQPVVNISWSNAMNFCEWLNSSVIENLPKGLVFRLPTEAEWEKAARGTNGNNWPWGEYFNKDNTNTKESGIGKPSDVGLFSPHGDSPYGCADMAGNVTQWTHSLLYPYPYNLLDDREKTVGALNSIEYPRVIRGGSYKVYSKGARCARRHVDISLLDISLLDILLHSYSALGFRVALSVPLL